MRMAERRTTRGTVGVAMAVAVFAVVLAFVPPARLDAAGGVSDDACVQCHVATFDEGLTHRLIHAPFFDRQCSACHVPDGAMVSVATATLITGSLVSQESLWTKRWVATSAAESDIDHRIILDALEPEGAYRFRVVVSDQAWRDGARGAASPWLGLRPGDVRDAADGTLTVPLPGLIEGGEASGTATLSRLGEATLLIRWQTDRPLFGWVELETMEPVFPQGGAGAEPAATAETHPPLRDPEEAAIDVCYSCHPAPTIGTSHPVRVYAAGNEIRIPDDLPTVRDGMITCVTCHDPHGADGKNLVRETIKTKLCVACHYRFRGTSTATMF